MRNRVDNPRERRKTPAAGGFLRGEILATAATGAGGRKQGNGPDGAVTDTKKPPAAKAARRSGHTNGLIFSYRAKRNLRRIATTIILYCTAVRGLVGIAVGTGHVPRPVLGQGKFRQFSVNCATLDAGDVNAILVTLDVQVSPALLATSGFNIL